MRSASSCGQGLLFIIRFLSPVWTFIHCLLADQQDTKLNLLVHHLFSRIFLVSPPKSPSLWLWKHCFPINTALFPVLSTSQGIPKYVPWDPLHVILHSVSLLELSRRFDSVWQFASYLSSQHPDNPLLLFQCYRTCLWGLSLHLDYKCISSII